MTPVIHAYNLLYHDIDRVEGSLAIKFKIEG